jgi:hypothetical protein
MDKNTETTNLMKLKTTEALSPFLALFAQIHGSLLKEVRQVKEYGDVVEISLQFDSIRLSIRAVGDDDTIDLSLEEPIATGELISQQQPWVGNVGKPTGWNWVMINQQGYLDGVLLSFGEVIPEIVITVVASELKVNKIVSS